METNISFEQQYALKYNDFHSKILSSLQILRYENDFVDVTLCCEDQSFSAHKVILSAISPYFRKILKENPCQHPIIILKDIAKPTMENLLLFIYNGEVQLHKNDLEHFIKTAKALKIQGLAEIEQQNFDAIKTNKKTIETQTETTKENLNSDVVQDKEVLIRRISCTSDSIDVLKSEPNSVDSEEQMILTTISTHSQQTEKHTDDQNQREIETIDCSASDHSNFENYNESEPQSTQYSSPSNHSHTSPTEENQNKSFTEFSKSLFKVDPESSQNTGQPYYRSSGEAVNQIMLKKDSTVCPYCNRNYSNLSNLRAHILNVHSQAQAWFSCRFCERKLKTKHYLINHEMSAHGISQRSKRPRTYEFVNEDANKNNTV